MSNRDWLLIVGNYLGQLRCYCLFYLLDRRLIPFKNAEVAVICEVNILRHPAYQVLCLEKTGTALEDNLVRKRQLKH